MDVHIHIDDRLLRPFAWVGRHHRVLVALTVLLGGAVAIAAPGDDVPNIFVAQTPISAGQVNDNFDALEAQILDLSSQLATNSSRLTALEAAVPPAPEITALDILDGSPGQTVTVTGVFAPGSTTATLGGAELSISNLTSTSFTYVSPRTATGVGKALVVSDVGTGGSATYPDAWTNSVALPAGGAVSTITVGGDTYRLHAFTVVGSSATFQTTEAIDADILVVAGGGSGAISHGNQDTGKGGGGAGGLLRASGHTIPSGSHPITVGSGGVGARHGNNTLGAQGNDGSESSAFGGTAVGGGGGGKSDGGAANQGRDGGCGGGGASRGNVNVFVGGSGIQTSPSGWTGYGNNGGDAVGNGNFGGGGGGGAGSAGGDATDATTDRSRGGDGGAGRDYSTVFGTTYGEYGWFGGGGGGGTRSYDSIYGQPPGGMGGGGDGNCGSEGANVQCANIDAMPNTGGGGGGSVESPSPGQFCSDAAGAGGSGVVLVRYPYQP